MAKRQWTQEQTLAFSTRDRTLLVSAAAGSGKTATLTERIIRSILDEENPADIRDMLIVTFTNAAVRELRERIGAAVRTAAAEHPENARLEGQLLAIKDAKIVTINSFCNDILRSSAEAVGMTPSYRIAEPQEAGIIADEILLGMIGAAYEGELTEVCTAEEFARLAEGLTGVKTEGELHEIFRYIYDKLSSTEDGHSVLFALAEDYKLSDSSPIEDTRHFGYIIDELVQMLCHYGNLLTGLRRELEEEGAPEKTLAVLDSDINLIDITLSDTRYESLHITMSDAEFMRMAPAAKCPSYEDMKKIRGEFVDNYRKYTTEYFSLSTHNLRDLYTVLYKNAVILAKFINEFDELFMAEKRRRGIVEFRDAERYAVASLYTAEGALSPTALELRQKYKSVYIDEYQDVNALQGKIFDAIASPDNCFMVGDIKQSIYGFRSAKPDLFAEKKSAFPKLGEQGDFPRASIFMSQNFRCDKTVIDFINEIFDMLFGALGSSIGYVPDDRLIFAKKYDADKGEAPTEIPPEIHIVECPRKKQPEQGQSASEFADEVLEEELSAIERSAEAVADKIASLVGRERLADGRLISAGDIAILMRSVRNTELIYANAIRARGIACEITNNTDFFYTEEVLLALSLLYVIDNPRKDVHLSALMTSPLFSFSFDELVAIRRSCPAATLYESLTLYTGRFPDCKRAKDFIQDIERLRTLGIGLSVDRLIALLYRESGLLTLACANGRRENLILLHGYARKYESSSFRGLYSFISYLNKIIENGDTFEASSEGEGESADCVHIITSHRSKGLEFPVTVIAEAGKRLRHSGADITSRIKLSPDFGLGFGVRDAEGLAMLENPPQRIIGHRINSKEYEEALRVLYVSLTRAREQLYIFGSCESVEHLEEKVGYLRSNFSPYVAKTFSNTLEMMLVCNRSAKVIKHCADAPAEASVTPQNDQASPDTPTAGAAISLPLDQASADEQIAETVSDSPSAPMTMKSLGINEVFDEIGDCEQILAMPEDPDDSSSQGPIPPQAVGTGVRVGPSAQGLDMTNELLRRFNFKYPREYALGIPEKISVSRLAPDVLDGNEGLTPDIGSLAALMGIEEPENEAEDGDAMPELHTLPAFMRGTDVDESARRGTATHIFLQFTNLEALGREGGAESEMKRLVDEEFLSQDDAKRVRLDEIKRFAASELFSDMKKAKHLYRELRFNVRLPACLFTRDDKRAEGLADTELLIQGVIDCIIEDEDGSLHLIDYKTDRLRRDELKNAALAAKRLLPRHERQLFYYCEAIKRIFGKPPKTAALYSTHGGFVIPICAL